MERDWNQELESRVAWIRNILGITPTSPGAGVVYGNSGGKDCTLAGILCRRATQNVLGVIMPCQSSQNYGSDRDHALLVAKQYDIQTIEVDISGVKRSFLDTLGPALKEVARASEGAEMGKMNMNPRLRMIVLYTLAQSRGAFVCGTGNRSEAQMGYFTKWGDGAYDFNPIADLTVSEIFDFLRFLGAPDAIINKAPSAGLFEGQTDEGEMGISYADIDRFLLSGEGDSSVVEKIVARQRASAHKRMKPPTYG
ncbi:MAG: NAD(+) synthase [Planctomycetia bacterium]|nr:NAD(+) synthase [Planctomycetia bacterium]